MTTIPDQALLAAVSPYTSARLCYSSSTSIMSGLMKRKVNRFGDFVLDRVIGRGMTGEVRLAWADETRPLAAKLVPKASINAKVLERLVSELHALQELHNPHTVSIREVVIDEKYLGVVMDWAEQGDVFQYLRANGPVDEMQAQRWLAQLVWAVDDLHSQSIVHRDIKPENLLLDQHYNIKLTDFEMSQDFRRYGFPMMSEVCGSPTYCPPEVVFSPSQGLYDGCKADIWAMGVTLFACVAGFLPFDDMKYETQTPRDIDRLYEHISATELEFPTWFSSELCDLLSMMLNKNFHHRCTIVDVKAHPWLAEYTSVWAGPDLYCRERYNSWTSNSSLATISELWSETTKQVVRTPIIWDPYVGA